MRRAALAIALLFVACARPGGEVQRAPVTVSAVRSAEAARPATAFVGEGSLEVRAERGKSKLALARLGIVATTARDIAETTVEHVFTNDGEETLEGTFRFPLPEGAMLTGLAMEIDGKLTEGELVEREKARKAYEDQVDRMIDPALLEWENGQTFKLRVFPIEPKKEKRVVLRFVAPLRRTAEGTFFAYRASSLEPERFKVSVDGVVVSRGRTDGSDVLVPAPGIPNGGSVVAEETKDAAFWVAHVRPSLTEAPVAPSAPQALIVLCDRSRSMLEARDLQKHLVALLIDKLGERDRFTVVTGDVRARPLGGLRKPTEKAAALAHVEALEPDGASDVALLVGAAREGLRDARAAGLQPVVVFLGDATATWGETRASELERIARETLGGATMHVVLLGKSTDGTTAEALAAAAHGRLLRPHTEADAERAASEITLARSQRRLEEVKLVGADGLDVPSAVPGTLYEGDDLMLAFRGAKGSAAPKEVRLVGKENGKDFAVPIALGTAAGSTHVADRWAKAKIERLERDGDAHKEEIVQTSLTHGVMSRYTSFLVLDSEEAYARYQIARRAKSAASDARPSGDVDGDTRRATVSPDHLQPGDPEVRIPAPPDAQSVVVVLPFGETKTATFEADERGGKGAWVARFLVDRRTPDGSYEIVVRVTHADGRVEILRLPYVVDTLHPNLDVTVTPKRGGAFEIRAKQRLSAAEIEAQAPSSAGTLAERRERYAHVLTDAKRVEVRTPDGQTLSLVHLRLGEFVGTWTPSGPLADRKLRVVAVDRALNETVLEVAVPR